MLGDLADIASEGGAERVQEQLRRISTIGKLRGDPVRGAVTELLSPPQVAQGIHETQPPGLNAGGARSAWGPWIATVATSRCAGLVRDVVHV